MARLSITTAWNEATDFLKLHFGALLTIAIALIALPSVAMQALGPSSAADPGKAPEPGLWLLMVPLVIVLNIAGSIALSSLALGRKGVVGEAIGHGFRRFGPLFGAIALVVLGLVLVFVPVIALTGIEAGDLVQPAPAKAGRIALAMLLFLAASLFLAVRLLLMTPVAAAERSGPVAIIRRSWSLTGPHFWKLLGFVLLMLVVLTVVMLVVTSVFGLLIAAVAGAPLPGTTGGFVLLLVGSVANAAFVVAMTTLVARIYVQLSGGVEPVGGATKGI